MEIKKPLAFKVAHRVTPVLTIQHTWTYGTESDAHPMQGLASWMLIHHGYAYVFFFNIVDVIAAGHGMDTLKDYIEGLGAEIENVMSCGVTSGNFVFVPLGFIPVVIGFSDDVKTDTTSHVAFSNHYILDMGMVNDASSSLRAEIIAFLTKSLSKDLKVWKNGNREALKEYVATFSDQPQSAPRGDDDAKSE